MALCYPRFKMYVALSIIGKLIFWGTWEVSVGPFSRDT